MRRCLLILVLASLDVVVFAENIPSMREAADRVDQFLYDRWSDDEVSPAAVSGDAEFCRRVWLDLAGLAPPVASVRAFLSDPSPDKRARLIDALLESPHHAYHMASRWNAVLLPPDAQVQLQQRGNVAALHEWLRAQFRRNVPYDYLVGGFLTAGGAGDSGPAIFYTSHSLQPEKLAAATSRIFMGIQLQCAQCHDHPFDRWTQEDFWRYAAFFSQLEQRDASMGGGGVIEDRVGRQVTLPESDRVMPPGYPGVSEPPEKDPGQIRRRQLTIWLASRDNPYFARAAVNRVWEHLFARGLVDPVDAMDAYNRPSHPKLLDYLADYFTAIRFDLRRLYATLARTQAYGRTSVVESDVRPAEDTFAAMTVKTLSPEQFFDSLQHNVYRVSASGPGDPTSPQRGMRQQFIARMNASGSSPREYPHGVVQALGLMHGPEMSGATDPGRIGLLATLEAPFLSDKDRIETLFLAVLSRLPSETEFKLFSTRLAAATGLEQRRAAFSDFLWVLLNTAECAVCP